MAADDTIISLGVDAKPAVDGLNEAAKAVKDMADATTAAATKTKDSAKALEDLKHESVKTSQAFRDAIGVNREVSVSLDSLSKSAKAAGDAQRASAEDAARAQARGSAALQAALGVNTQIGVSYDSLAQSARRASAVQQSEAMAAQRAVAQAAALKARAWAQEQQALAAMLAEKQRVAAREMELAAQAEQAARELAAARARAWSEEQQALRAMMSERERVANHEKSVAAESARIAEETKRRAEEAARIAREGSIGSQLISGLAPIAAATAAAFSVGAIVNFGRESVAAAAQAEEAMARLRSALAAQGQVAMTGQLVELAGQLQATTRYSDDAIVSMQALASRMGVPAASMADFTKAAVDMAAALQMDVGQAGEMLAKTLDGTAGKLNELVPGMADLSEGALKAGLAFDVAGKAFRGAAIDDAATISGSLSNLSTAWGEVKESVGFAIVELTGLQSKSGGLATFLTSEVTPAIREWAEGWGIARDAMASVVDESPRLFSALSKINMLSRDWFVNDIAEWVGAGFRSVDLEGAKFGPRDGGGGSESNEAARAAQAAREQERILNEERIAARNARWAAREKDMSGAAQERQQASDAHAEQMKAARERAAEFQNAGTVAQKNLDLAWDAAGTEAQRQELLRGIVSELDKAGGAGWELVKAGELTAAAYRDQMGVIGAMQSGVERLMATEQQRAMIDSSGLSSETIAKMQALALPGADKDTGLALQGTDASGNTVPIDDGTAMDPMAIAGLEIEASAMLRAERQAAYDELIEQAEGVSIALADQEARWNLLTEAQRRDVQAKQFQAQMHQTLRGAQMALGSALASTASAFVQQAITGEFSAKKLLAAGLNSLSQLAQQKMVEQIALGWAAIGSHGASGNPAAHFTSAAVWGTIAIASGIAGAAAGGGGGGAGGGGTGRDREDAPSRTDDFSSTRQRAEEGQRMPAISVVFTGNGIIAGTTPEAFASAVTPFIQEVVRESGGREGSVRG